VGAKLEEAVKKAKKTYDLQIGNLKDFVTDIEAISTGNIALDVITGVGGLPRGRIIELYGPP
jgi:recombination protein RecA